MKEKICSRCQESLALSEFHKQQKSKDGLGAYCKNCKKDYATVNRDKIRKADRKYKNNHKELIKERKRAFYFRNKISEQKRAKEYNSSHREERNEYSRNYDKSVRGRFSTYKRNAKKKDREWGLSFIEFEALITQPCFYCGDLNLNKKYNGIDRINNALGYFKDNCVPCCTICNYMKRDYSKRIFFEKIKQIQEYHDL